MAKSDDIFILAKVQKEIEDITKVEEEMDNKYFKGLILSVEVDTKNFNKQVDTLKLDLNEELTKKILLEIKDYKSQAYDRLKKTI